jgi:polyisoprenyl-teichoic acid--peptidoglycan teichoic acid transferase
MKLKLSFIFIIAFVIFFSAFVAFILPWYLFATKTLNVSPIKALVSLDSLKKIDDQVNILILGIAGGDHAGPLLSDSILVANYNFKTNKIITINMPRDIWSDTLKDRINSAYAYGEAKEVGGGLKLAKAEVGAIVGQPIQYAVVINFVKFKSLIDFLGGVDVNIQTSFTDTKFPITGKEEDLCNGDPEYKCRYETLTFNKGPMHMNGETALNFVRSRNAIGEEGTDFARGKRQQKVITAIEEKIMNIAKTQNIEKIKTLYKNLNQSVDRDITNQQLVIIAKNIVMKGKFSLINLPLSVDLFDIPDYVAEYEYKYVLIPKNNDYDKIHQTISCFFANGDETPCLNKETIKE